MAFIDKKKYLAKYLFFRLRSKTSELEMYYSTLWISESTVSILMPIFLYYIPDVYLIYYSLTANQFLLTLIRFQSHGKNHFTQWQFQEGKNFFVWVKKLELISRCARQMYYKMYYKIYFIYFRQFYKRRNFFADIDQISKPWKETTSQTYKPQEGKNFCLIEKIWKLFQDEMYFCLFLWRIS